MITKLKYKERGPLNDHLLVTVWSMPLWLPVQREENLSILLNMPKGSVVYPVYKIRLGRVRSVQC